jgi:hypothetical protein
MYSKQEASQLRQAFWTAFGKYMQPILSSEGEKINWINYKTGIKHIFFRMNAGKGASIAIEIRHPDLDEQKKCFEQFLQLKEIFKSIVHEEWNWDAEVEDENGKVISQIYTEIGDVHVFNRLHWPDLISFFKQRIIAIDEFWNLVKVGFET